MSVRKAAVIYFAAQGVGVLAWWIVLYYSPFVRGLFEMGSDGEVLLAFWIPDVFFLALFSLVAAALLHARHAFAAIALWFTIGLVSYSAIYTLSYALLTDSGWLGVVFMLPSMIASGVFGVGLPPVSDYMFRESERGSSGWILTKTLGQIVVVWSVILVVFPYLITIVENKIGIPTLSFSFQGLVAALLFVPISCLGVYSAYTMSTHGGGTPLPLDHAKEFVVSGAYAYVRNPMALSGIGQGIAVALFYGSPLVLIYALLGSAVWQVIFRPLEEDDLSKRFGSEYEMYREKVKCWIPNLRPYKAPKATS